MNPQNSNRSRGTRSGTPRRKKSKPTPGRKRPLLLGLVIIFAAVIFFASPYLKRAPKSATIYIPANATYQQVEDSLARHFNPGFASRTVTAMKLFHPDLATRQGQYRIEKGTMIAKVGRRLAAGAQTPVRLTINGFRDIDSLIERIASKMAFSADDFRKALYSPRTLQKYGLTPENAMALFVNDTYEVYWSATPEALLRKIGKNYDTLWDQSNRAKATEMGLTPAEVMTLASIAEEESNDRNERGVIGRLYANRLHKGMRLQSDPTVKYAVGDFSIKRINSDHLKVNSPYNTYRNAGLPPGPIRTVDKRTVIRILDTPPHNYLYMCAKEDFSGTHNFAETFSQHTLNANRYRKALDARNIH